MTDPFYNISYGPGMEGILNYCNEITDGWFANLFLIFIFVSTTFVLSKSEWKMNSVLSYSFFVTLVTALVMSLFVELNGYIVYISVIGLALSVFIGIIVKSKF